MKDFEVIYKILKALHRAMDKEELNMENISAEALGISEMRRERLLIMLQEAGYITGIRYERTLSDYYERICESITPAITLKGLEYLEENGLMKKAMRVMSGLKDITPGI